eukprot:TRINITY_DN21690_c0_g1_i1.p1 TRINITY_DN21690_c0_g1~~TRINITY_DN21690_c0_g1_i1.p1  ORF type:complete len:713 (+),score=354.88 TRINITY_DN21690_c0_g1_i1:90-2141(+)
MSDGQNQQQQQGYGYPQQMQPYQYAPAGYAYQQPPPGYVTAQQPAGGGDGPAYQQGYQAAVRDFGNGRQNLGSQAFFTLLNAGLFLGLPLYILYRMNKGGGPLGGGDKGNMMEQMMERMNPVPKRNFRVAVKDTKFKDVIGIPEAKEEVQQYVEFLKNPSRFSALGAKLPRGALLTGKPGTGKTLLAKAVAGEADVPFFSCSGADFIEIFGGSGPKRVRELFAEAKKSAPAVIFIDELDAVGSKRSGMGDQGIGGEENRTTNALLAEMDGMGTKDNVVVFAATNHPEALDTALTRAGRFDRKVELPVPDEKARVELFEFYLSKITTASNFEEKSGELKKKVEAAKAEQKRKQSASDYSKKKSEYQALTKELEDMRNAEEKKPNFDKVEETLLKQISQLKKEIGEEQIFEPNLTPPKPEEVDEAKEFPKKLAARTPGVTPATINTIVNESALVAADKEASFVTPAHVQDAIDNVLIGKKHRSRMSDTGLQRVAYHEAGHTVTQWLLGTQTPVIKVSIIPRGRAGGYTQFRQEEELDPKTDAFLFDQLIVMLGGRCAEKIFFNDMSTGAHDDLQRAFQQAQAKVQHFGMNDVVGPIAINPQAEQRGRAFSSVSENLKSRIEDQAKAVVAKAEQACLKLLTDNRDKMEKVGAALLEKKEINETDLAELLGPKVAKTLPVPTTAASA